ncbi:DUF932 domain-containing protein [Streptomyces sp. S07_1.15]|uniref:DUF932 domain-containing protein n=1 Tax=Streptomyces sp. S07_1.15 TaxID=2873925 RepID=UPI001D15BD69|nr:DUF932 domain-containing protein [Streptomyces sp. S07_1.15]MCC3655729.1 DUF932 domain-containing protein [Streptomyces sp. S07_1.15]
MTQQTAEGGATERAPHTGTRNAELSDLLAVLADQRGRKLDMVASASNLTAQGGNLVVSGVDPVVSADGVTIVDGAYRPTTVADEGIAAKLGIPAGYLRRMRAELPDLYDLNVSAWLEAAPDRTFMVRAFKGEEGPDRNPGAGVARAFLSPSYKQIDHEDILAATLQGVQDAGHPVRITGCDLTDRRMIVRVESEAVEVRARELLRGYRSPFTGQSGEELPMVSAGFVITNSEVGAGAYTLTPRAVVRVCENGLTMSQDVMRSVHLGGRHEEGVVRWSDATQQKILEVITSKTADAVRQFLNPEYVETKLREIERDAGREIKDPQKTVEVVTKGLGMAEQVRQEIFAHFIKGGQTTAGGVMQAVTSVAQTIPDADAAHDLETQALPALRAAAAHAS